MITLTVNNSLIQVDEGTTVAAAILSTGVDTLRTSVTGDVRGALCGMGICFECRVTINGVCHQRSCILPAADGMEITTDA